MSLKDVGALVIIAFCLSQVESATQECKNFVKDVIIHSYSTSGTICKREAKFSDDIRDPAELAGKMRRRDVEKLLERNPLFGIVFEPDQPAETQEIKDRPLIRTLPSREAEKDFLEQFTLEDLEEIYSDIVARIGRSPLAAIDVNSFSRRCCQNIDVCRNDPRTLLRC